MSDTSVYNARNLSVDQQLALRMALGFFTHLAGDRAVAWSGGSEPGTEINRSAVAAMAERGIDITDEYPKPWTDEIVRAADIVVTMGCGDACPIFPGTRYEDWDLGDPGGLTVDAVRPIRDDIERRVRVLLDRLGDRPVPGRERRRLDSCARARVRMGWVSAVASGASYYAVASWLYLTGLRQVPASVAGIYLTLIPVFGVTAGHTCCSPNTWPFASGWVRAWSSPRWPR